MGTLTVDVTQQLLNPLVQDFVIAVDFGRGIFAHEICFKRCVGVTEPHCANAFLRRGYK